MDKETFEKEISICKEMAQKQGSCMWGKCSECGVIPLLYKLGRDELIEDPKQIKELKSRELDIY